MEQRRRVAEHRTLCLLMQRLESWLFINQACDRMRVEHPRVPLITIHDSVLTTQEHAPTVRAVLEQTMRAYGVPAKFKEETTAAKPEAAAA